jgi:ammonium transporter, Amt family
LLLILGATDLAQQSMERASCRPHNADVAWILMSSVLVLGMFPGLAFFEAGLLRGKNTTSIITQVFTGLTILCVMWVAFGYSLTFGDDHFGLIGDFNKAFFLNTSFKDCYPGTRIPTALQELFQLKFACITPLLMTGAFAERMAWKPFMLLMVLWEIFVYYPVGHWMWHPEGWLALLGAQDFAGGIVIHETAGVSSLVVVYVLGQRRGFDKYKGEFPYSSLPFAAIGVTLLWTGWFGFNGGSALASNAVAIHAVVNSQIGAAVCAVVWLRISTLRHGYPSMIALLNGAIAGLAGITPACGYISPPGAFVLGIILGISTYASAIFLKHRLALDDALDVSSVHGVAGVIGALFIGVAAQSAISGSGNGFLIDGSFRLLFNQCVALVAVGAWSGAVTYGVLQTIALWTPLRVTAEQERVGLDEALHFEPIMHEDHGTCHHIDGENGGETLPEAMPASALTRRPSALISMPRRLPSYGSTSATVSGNRNANTSQGAPAVPLPDEFGTVVEGSHETDEEAEE